MSITSSQIQDLLAGAGIRPLKVAGPDEHPQIHLEANELLAAADRLRTDPNTYFDLLSCLTAIDLGQNSEGILELQAVYVLYSITKKAWCSLYITVKRDQETIPSVSTIWPTAEWHEREAFDLVGIRFDHHPDLRRILLPADWQGYPLRKDYQQQDVYHGLKLRYERD